MKTKKTTNVNVIKSIREAKRAGFTVGVKVCLTSKPKYTGVITGYNYNLSEDCESDKAYYRGDLYPIMVKSELGRVFPYAINELRRIE